MTEKIEFSNQPFRLQPNIFYRILLWGIVERAGKLAGLPFPIHAHMLAAAWNRLLSGESRD